MDWTKIPTTLITRRYTDQEVVSIVKFQLVWAMNEEQPDRNTCLRYMTKKQYETAIAYLDSITSIVGDDVCLVKRRREADKKRYNKNKDLNKSPTQEQPRNYTGQAAKIRLDKDIYNNRGYCSAVDNVDNFQNGEQPPLD